ncbi:DNA-binding transcriptional regulator, LysR family [Pseudomonas flavescens]|uniref:DNA-binding transcriptional regulator, LysR family n=1 Tax=Phytopseudomonas flavescens TaxID=29435 RepID=A0A1G8PJJ1_9GAMM|nr:LysR family transcriptional regulator [Pseudomonas flavescens]SDI92468.1 DNA-binding transcriptional regulator, LysR family [Pseudomonas flavescens]
MVSTRQLHYFVAIVECGSFSAAAERLFIAQSALSRQIKALEDQLQAALFLRTARQPVLTDAGAAFFARASSLLTELQAASQQALEIARGQRGTLRLNHSSTVPLSGLLMERLARYLAAHPDVRMEIAQQSSEAQLQELSERRLDIGLIRLPVLRQHDGLVLHALFDEPMLLAVGDQHRLAQASSVSLAELRDESFVSIPHPQRGGLSYRAVELCTRAGFYPRAARVVSRKTTQLQLIQAGFGIALLPLSMQAITPTGVRLIALADEDCRTTVALACRQNDNALVRQFVDQYR